MNILFNILASVVASAVIFVGGMNLPASIFSLPKTPLFGAFTEISTATNLADFPTTYNANLNKTIEVGTTSVASITTLAGLTTANALTSASALATIGTITTGVWNGTAIPVNKGGTGTTSPSTYMVILGNGSLGLTIASSTGTSGQFLTSNGAGAYPSWTTSAVDQTIDYNFTSSAFRVKNLHASSTVANPIVLNGVSYSTPSNLNISESASSTALTVSDSGVISRTKMLIPRYTILDRTDLAIATNNATSTESIGIPASVLTASSTIKVSGNYTNNNTDCTIQLRDSTTSTILATLTLPGESGVAFTGTFDLEVFSDNSISAQEYKGRALAFYITDTTDSKNRVTASEGSSSFNFANASNFVLVGIPGAGTCTVTAFTMEVNP